MNNKGSGVYSTCSNNKYLEEFYSYTCNTIINGQKEKTIEYNGDSCMTRWVKDTIFSWSFGEHNPLLKSCRTCIYKLLLSTQIESFYT